MTNEAVKGTVLLETDLLEPSDVVDVCTINDQPSQIHNNNTSQCSYLKKQHDFHVPGDRSPSEEHQSTNNEQDDTAEAVCENARDDQLVEGGGSLCCRGQAATNVELHEGCFNVQEQVVLPEYGTCYLKPEDETCVEQAQVSSIESVCDPEQATSGVQAREMINSEAEEHVLTKEFTCDPGQLSSDVVLTYLNTSQGPQFLLVPVNNVQNSAVITPAIVNGIPVPSTRADPLPVTPGDTRLLNVTPAACMAGQQTDANGEISLTKQKIDQIHECKWTGCQETFARLQNLVNHISDVHIKLDCFDEMYVCQWLDCPRKGKGFNARYKVLIHVRTHTQEKPHVCYVCRKRFSRLENLKIHNRTHTGERPYACPYLGCQKAYSNSSDRFKHVLTHRTERPYCCKAPQCNKSYTDPSSLRKHMRAHGHVKPEKQNVIEEPIQPGDLSGTSMATEMLAPCFNSPDIHFLSTSSMTICSLPSTCSETSDRLLANPLLSSATSTEATPGATGVSAQLGDCKTEHAMENSEALSGERPVSGMSLPTDAHTLTVAATSVDASPAELTMESSAHQLLDPEIGVVDHQNLTADSLENELSATEEQCSLRDDLMDLSSISPTNCTCGKLKKRKSHHKSSGGLRNMKRNCSIAPKYMYTQDKKMPKLL